MFFIFVKACKKYKFNFILNMHGKTAITLIPENTFENIVLYRKHSESLNMLFVRAIKKMKNIAKGRI